MPFHEFFAEQLDELIAFAVAPFAVVRVVAVDPEMRGVLLRMLGGLDQDPEFPHLLLARDRPFLDPVSWFTALREQLEQEIVEHAEALRASQVDPDDSDGDVRLGAPWRFLRLAERLAERLPDEVGALVHLIESERVEDEAGFARSIRFLADSVRSRWLKFIVLDDRSDPKLKQLAADHPRVDAQSFWLSPDEMRERLDAALEAVGYAPPAELLGQAAAFAGANGDHARAEALLRQRLEQVERDGGAPRELALANLALGGALLSAGQPDPAAEALLRACELCSTHALHEVAPMAYTNLGAAMHGLGDFAHAFAALRVGREFFRAQGNLPGEAFVCDALAKMHEERGEMAEAMRAWRYALGLYEGVANPHLADVRSAGRADIVVKLARLEGSGGAG